jgi:hypothetical protein
MLSAQLAQHISAPNPDPSVYNPVSHYSSFPLLQLLVSATAAEKLLLEDSMLVYIGAGVLVLPFWSL